MKFDFPPKAQTKPENEESSSYTSFLSTYKDFLLKKSKTLLVSALLLVSNFSEAQTKDVPLSLDKNTIGKTEATTQEVGKVNKLFNRAFDTFSFFSEHQNDTASLKESQELFSKLLVSKNVELDQVLSYADTVSKNPNEQYIVTVQITKDENGLPVISVVENKGDTTSMYTLSNKTNNSETMPVLLEQMIVGKEGKVLVNKMTGYPQTFDEMNTVLRTLEKHMKPAIAEVSGLKSGGNQELVKN